MQTVIRYFASVREAVGIGSETVELPEDLATLGDVRDWLARRSPRHAEALGQGRPVRMACDQAMGDAATALVPGREIAFFPPVTGG